MGAEGVLNVWYAIEDRRGTPAVSKCTGTFAVRSTSASGSLECFSFDVSWTDVKQGWRPLVAPTKKSSKRLLHSCHQPLQESLLCGCMHQHQKVTTATFAAVPTK